MTEYNKNIGNVMYVTSSQKWKKNSTPKTAYSSNKLLPDSKDKKQNNITERKNYVVNVSTENSFDSLGTDDSEDEHSTSSHDNSLQTESGNMNRSCPDLGNKVEELEELRNKNNNLETKLQKAENEIDALLSENCTLKKQIEDYEKKICNLTRICKSTSKETTPNVNTKRKSTNRSKLSFTQSLPTTPIQPKPIINNDNFENMKDTVQSMPSKHQCRVADEAVNSGITASSPAISIEDTMKADQQHDPTSFSNNLQETSTASSTKENEENSYSNIIILVDEQALGLSKKLIKSRQNK